MWLSCYGPISTPLSPGLVCEARQIQIQHLSSLVYSNRHKLLAIHSGLCASVIWMEMFSLQDDNACRQHQIVSMLWIHDHPFHDMWFVYIFTVIYSTNSNFAAAEVDLADDIRVTQNFRWIFRCVPHISKMQTGAWSFPGIITNFRTRQSIVRSFCTCHDNNG